MKKSTIAAFVGMTLVGTGVVLAQDKKHDPAAPKQPAAPAKPEAPAQPAMPSPSPDEIQKMMAEMTAPAEEHKHLWKLEGTWDQALTWNEGGQDMKATSSAKFTKVFNGMFMQQEVNGKMFGMPFHGMELMGYSKATKKYQSVWIDSMGTGMMITEGTPDSTGKVITFTGTMDDPMMGGTAKVKTVVTWTDDNTFTYEMFGTMGDQEQKMMSIVYTRSKDAKPSGEGMQKMTPAMPAKPATPAKPEKK